MPLTEVERNIAKTVLDRFLNLKEGTPRRPLVTQFKAPEALDHLVQCSVLRTHDGQSFLPMALAFHCCGDADALSLAKKSVEVVIHVLQNLFEVELEKTEFTPADVEAHARKIYDIVEPETIKLGLYLAQEFGVFAGWSGNPQHTEITWLRISESIVKLKNVGNVWNDHMRQYTAYLEREGTLEMKKQTATTNPDRENAESSANQGILILISHSSKDKVLAESLIDLLRSGLGLLASQIRCSSVDGYRLPAGVTTDAQLRTEVKGARVLIGLITPGSLVSPYVLFELGARWGAGLFMVPLLAGVKTEELPGPLSGLNALSCSVEAQLHQLLDDVARQLELRVQSAASYSRYVSALKKVSDAVWPSAVVQPSATEEMVFEESVRWKRKNGEREGPYCPVCYDDKHKEIHLMPGATKGTYSCGVCRNSFTTNEYNPRPARRQSYRSR